MPWMPKENTSLLHILNTNAGKAAMVKSLHIELRKPILGGVEIAMGPILIQFSQTLKGMSNLVDLTSGKTYVIN